MKPKYFIAGSRGQLGSEFVRKLKSLDLEFVGADIGDINLADEVQVFGLVESFKPNFIINCAAYTAVDNAEKDPETAFEVNATIPGILGRAAAKCGAVGVHYSTDYVFDGKKESGLYVESDPVNPINRYGESKAAGEKAFLDELPDGVVFRLSWVYGMGKQNFIYKFLNWLAGAEFLKIACDEYSVPTSAETVVEATLKSLECGVKGIRHLCSSGFCSRYEWADAVRRYYGNPKFLRPVSKDIFNLPAERPYFTAMSNRALSDELGYEFPDWRDDLEKFLDLNDFCA